MVVLLFLGVHGVSGLDALAPRDAACLYQEQPIGHPAVITTTILHLQHRANSPAKPCVSLHFNYQPDGVSRVVSYKPQKKRETKLVRN